MGWGLWLLDWGLLLLSWGTWQMAWDLWQFGWDLWHDYRHAYDSYDDDVFQKRKKRLFVSYYINRSRVKVKVKGHRRTDLRSIESFAYLSVKQEC